MKQFTAESISKDLETKGLCNIPGVGKIYTVAKGERKGRNPATGEAITIPAQTVVKYKMSQTIKDRLNQK